jgi:hypothetical protein
MRSPTLEVTTKKAHSPKLLFPVARIQATYKGCLGRREYVRKRQAGKRGTEACQCAHPPEWRLPSLHLAPGGTSSLPLPILENMRGGLPRAHFEGLFSFLPYWPRNFDIVVYICSMDMFYLSTFKEFFLKIWNTPRPLKSPKSFKWCPHPHVIDVISLLNFALLILCFSL